MTTVSSPSTVSTSQLLLLMTVMVMTTVMVCTGDTGGAVTCTAFTTTSETHVVCNFGHDISRASLNVRFFHPDLNPDPETTVMCNYVTGSGGLVCQTADDVTSTTVVSDQMTITRGAALDKVGGQYICQPVPPPDSMRFEPCNLTYLDTATRTAQPPTDPTEPAGNDTILYVAVMVTLIIVGLVVTCIILFIKRDRIRKWRLGALWPGAVGDPMENDPQSPRATAIPEGLPQYFYNLGWREGVKDGDPEPGDKNAPRGRDTHHRQGPDREPNLTDTATLDQPLLLPAKGSVKPSATTSFIMDEPRGSQLREERKDEEEKRDETGKQLTRSSKEITKEAKEAKKKAEKARKQAGEARKKAEEARKKAEEARKKAEDAKSQGKDENKVTKLEKEAADAESKADELGKKAAEAEEAKTLEETGKYALETTVV
ncbi:uncharacterized protein LOC143291719 isoform X1 [Babylonia areolata]|uniref:uncharacterized protein LOC143291719 isoform X1 n=1 Tax=Babylonia areolata TaxID=304850 RepID=UPI003FD1578A